MGVIVPSSPSVGVAVGVWVDVAVGVWVGVWVDVGSVTGALPDIQSGNESFAEGLVSLVLFEPSAFIT